MKFDITQRLREPPFGTETSERLLMSQAADEIDTLRAENERLRAALEGLADAHRILTKKETHDLARAALSEAQP